MLYMRLMAQDMVFMLIGINEEDNIGSGMLKTNTCESGHRETRRISTMSSLSLNYAEGFVRSSPE